MKVSDLIFSSLFRYAPSVMFCNNLIEVIEGCSKVAYCNNLFEALSLML